MVSYELHHLRRKCDADPEYQGYGANQLRCGWAQEQIRGHDFAAHATIERRSRSIKSSILNQKTGLSCHFAACAVNMNGPVSTARKSAPGPGRKRGSHLMNGLAAHREAEQAQIDQQQRSHEQRETNQVNDFENRKNHSRASHKFADRAALDPFEGLRRTESRR